MIVTFSRLPFLLFQDGFLPRIHHKITNFWIQSTENESTQTDTLLPNRVIISYHCSQYPDLIVLKKEETRKQEIQKVPKALK